jgi:hypothetical protein
MTTQSAILSVTIPVNSPAAHVFSCLTNWAGQSEWMVGTTVRATKQQGIGVGGEISAFSGISPFGFTDTMVITDWEPPLKCSVLHTGKIVQGTGDFIVTPLSAHKSLFTWTEDFIIPFGILGKTDWLIARPFAQLGVQVSLQRFARWAEAQAGAKTTY